MIELHRLQSRAGALHINPELIQTIEAHPDTVITLSTGSRFLVAESPAAVVDEIRHWRASILATAAAMEFPSAAAA